ncbi:O-methyltransferase-domain-containing protein [Bombardia bombarda]|uniref:O-methyltransferase-domain-containing protein n=1 Tax=Bombardia bombarda TaxID=252184 RepID=A0AA40BVA3_9PEZI|nr:O-methyltransferase-domain-containing protein [Bombardia bombarda]
MSTTIPTPSLVSLATEILRAATTLEDELKIQNLPAPDLSSHGRQDYLDILTNPTAMSARSALIEASRNMLLLARGPIETLRSTVLVDRTGIMVLRVIYCLKIAEHVPLSGSISMASLAAKLDVHPTPLARILRFAYTMRVFHQPVDQPDTVAHTALSAAISTFDPYLWIQLSETTKTHAASFNFPRALKEWPASPLTLTDPQGRDFWRIIQEDDPDGRGMERFSAAMRTYMQTSHGSSNTYLVDGFDWAGLGSGTVVDVGGGNGHGSVAVARNFPQLKVLVQDLPKNEQPAAETIQNAKLEEGRVAFQAHDFFTTQPKELQPTAYLLSRVLHDWSDEDGVRILKHLVPAMKKDGARLIVVERLLPDQPGEIPLHHEAQLRSLDLLMFTFYGGGCERSRQQWENLFRAADPGLKVVNVRSWQESVGSELSMMEVRYMLN